MRVYKDDDKWCAVKDDFIDLQESDAGFGETKQEAIDSLRMVGFRKTAQSLYKAGYLNDEGDSEGVIEMVAYAFMKEATHD